MAEQPSIDRPVIDLTIEECWSLLHGSEFGRLAYHLVDEVHLVPINYVVDGGTILFQTAPGNKLLAAELQSSVAFEVDGIGDEAAWSVVVRGRVRRLPEHEQQRVAQASLRSWLPTHKYEAVELIPEVVTGRRFLLRRTPGDDDLD